MPRLKSRSCSESPRVWSLSRILRRCSCRLGIFKGTKFSSAEQRLRLGFQKVQKDKTKSQQTPAQTFSRTETHTFVIEIHFFKRGTAHNNLKAQDVEFIDLDEKFQHSRSSVETERL